MSGALVGVDVGGTRIKAVRLRDGSVEKRLAVPSPDDLADRLGPRIAEVVRALGTADEPMSDPVGVVVPGLVDDRTGRALWSANLGWRDLDVPGEVGAALGLRVVAGHDVRAGLLAEHRLGAAAGADAVLFVPLGTGLAGALLVDGRIVLGSPWTGELGHVVVDPVGPPCGCGRRGCLEAVAGAAAIGRWWRERSGRPGDAETVASLVARGDPVATEVWSEAVEALARCLSPVVTAVGVSRVVIGGGLVASGEILLGPLRAGLHARLPDGMTTEVVPAALGEWAGAIGAACLASDSQPAGLSPGRRSRA